MACSEPHTLQCPFRRDLLVGMHGVGMRRKKSEPAFADASCGAVCVAMCDVELALKALNNTKHWLCIRRAKVVQKKKKKKKCTRGRNGRCQAGIRTCKTDFASSGQTHGGQASVGLCPMLFAKCGHFSEEYPVAIIK